MVKNLISQPENIPRANNRTVDGGSKKRLFELAEILFMPTAFYVLTQWDKIDTWEGRILWIAVLVLVQNEYLAIRASYQTYNLWLYLTDLTSLFIYVFSVSSLTKGSAKSAIGYNPTFWIYISLLWLCYAVWDYLTSRLEDDPHIKKELVGWGWIMLLAFFITLLCGIALLGLTSKATLSTNSYTAYILQLIPLVILCWAIIRWALDLGVTLGKKQLD